MTTAKLLDANVTLAKLAANSVDASKVVDGSLTDAEVAAANKDGVVGTPSMRTLGTGAQQAAAGNHGHAASAIAFTPADTIAATDVQAAVVEALQDARAYADSVLAGASPKVTADWAPTGALPTYVISGGGSTMTMAATGALAAQDGVTAVLGDIFFYDQDAQHGGVDNGLWEITVLGALGVAMVATRVPGLAVGAHAKGALTRVAEGATRRGEEPLCITDDPTDVVGTDALTWTDVGVFGNLATTSPADVTKAASAVGTSNKAARADHKHDVSTAAVGAIAVGDSAAEGSATSLARSDHRHSLAAPGAPADLAAAASAGSSSNVARQDHVHSYGPSGRWLKVAIGTSASYASTATVPASAVVFRCLVVVTTAYSGGATITVGRTGSASLVQATTDNDPQTIGTHETAEPVDWGGSAVAALVTIAGSPGAGAGVVYLFYAVPET